ncbi:MAG TPA: hypothetical protein VKZ98_03085 [Aquaticitalea sp.]|nr:hypothetical protein [Aquaticitalea sp.]
MLKSLQLIALFTIVMLNFSCIENNSSKNLSEEIASEISTDTLAKSQPLTQEFKKYWYSNLAEITTYKLEQARYGEMREGHAVLIFVTEPFLPDEQVKADRNVPSNISILKLNATKNFNTGIYPYSIMQSVFYPVANNQHALKISCSVQEWCGHVYMQLNNHEMFEVTSHSYFEGEADKDFTINKSILENELWTQLRINPATLPTGNLKIIPSFEFLRLRHVPMKAYDATATLSGGNYSINYPELNRTITIHFNKQFPYEIDVWEETFFSGFGEKTKEMTTKATKIKTIKSAYWQKNNNSDNSLRDSLGINQTPVVF